MNDYRIAKDFIKNDKLQKAAVFIGDKVYKQPYTDYRGKLISANFTYTCRDGTIINRPNHNMANVLRSLYYLKPILE